MQSLYRMCTVTIIPRWHYQAGWILGLTSSQSRASLRYNTKRMSSNNLLLLMLCPNFEGPRFTIQSKYDLIKWILNLTDAISRLACCRLCLTCFWIWCNWMCRHYSSSRRSSISATDNRWAHRTYKRRFTSCKDWHQRTWLYPRGALRMIIRDLPKSYKKMTLLK